MTDNLQGSNSEQVVNSEEIKKSETQVFEAKTTESAPVENKEEKRVPLHELYKERNRRKAAEEEVGQLRQRMDELDSKFSKVRQTQDNDELVEQAVKKLGIDKEAAIELLDLQRKVAEKAVPKQSQTNTVSDPVLRAMDDFKRRAAESSQDYEDWNEMIPAMQAIMGKEIEQNGLGAYNKSPEYYYSKALKAQRDSDKRVKQEDAIDKSNGAQMATVETGSSSTRSGSNKITQSVFDANRNDPKWVRENETEIKQLWRQGKLK